MIHQKISKIKLSATNKIDEEVNTLVAANTIQELLTQIDFNAEVVPMHDSEKLIKLFTSLKGKELSTTEIGLIKEISLEEVPTN